MDADGDLDLILCAIDVPGFVAGAFRAYRNDGKGFFTDVTAEAMPATAVGRGWDVEVADLNDDGALDMALGGWGTQARLLLGTVKQPVSIRGKGGKSGAMPRSHFRTGAGRVAIFPHVPGTGVLIRTWPEGTQDQDWADFRGRARAFPAGYPQRP
jgi:hypothetical protein